VHGQNEERKKLKSGKEGVVLLGGGGPKEWEKFY